SLPLSSRSSRSAVLLPMPGTWVSRVLSCSATACARSATDIPESTASAVRAHHEVREEGQRLADARQGVERAHRHVELVGDAADIDQHLRRMLGGELPREPADHWM